MYVYMAYDQETTDDATKSFAWRKRQAGTMTEQDVPSPSAHICDLEISAAV